jgi:hypothetical protein
MLTPAEKDELLNIEAMAKMLLDKAKAFRQKAAPQEGEVKKRKPTKKELVKQYVESQFAKRRAKMIKQQLQNSK